MKNRYSDSFKKGREDGKYRGWPDHDKYDKYGTESQRQYAYGFDESRQDARYEEQRREEQRREEEERERLEEERLAEESEGK